MTTKLVGLFAVSIVAQLGGCYLPPDNTTEIATINAQWSFRSKAANATVACPAGFDTISVNSQEIDANGKPVGDPYVDLFDCADGFGATAPLAPAVYQTSIDVTDGKTGERFAQSLSQTIDVVDTDKTFDTTILTDGGYFQLDWDLVGGVTGQRLECSEVVGLDGIEVTGTGVGNLDNTATIRFACGDHTGVTGGFLQGAYRLSIDAFDNGKALGVPVTLSDKSIRARNQVTDLGHVDIPIAGR